MCKQVLETPTSPLVKNEYILGIFGKHDNKYLFILIFTLVKT
jgi:hypothetical protein